MKHLLRAILLLSVCAQAQTQPVNRVAPSLIDECQVLFTKFQGISAGFTGTPWFEVEKKLGGPSKTDWRQNPTTIYSYERSGCRVRLWIDNGKVSAKQFELQPKTESDGGGVTASATSPCTPVGVAPGAVTGTTSSATSTSPQVQGSGVAENGSYYGEPNVNGVPKTVHVNGYYRKDGTYVQGHYRSAPGTNPRKR